MRRVLAIEAEKLMKEMADDLRMRRSHQSSCRVTMEDLEEEVLNHLRSLLIVLPVAVAAAYSVYDDYYILYNNLLV